ncbi:MAG: hypothetical protein LBB82_04810 [Treponema sp.]|jgi:hypothetical protein|nr:hypothetical protein [Treponema sp.]
MKRKPLIPCFLAVAAALCAEPLSSPTWGFRIDPPAGYELAARDGNDSYSFASPFGAALDLAVYRGKTAGDLAKEIGQKLSNRGETEFFDYNGKKAALIELKFPHSRARGAPLITGWALVLELDAKQNNGARPAANQKPVLAALSYGEAGQADQLHLSILDSICGGDGDRFTPGPVTSFVWPRGEWEEKPLALDAGRALFRAGDAEAAQAVVDREFAVLRLYTNSPLWQEAWTRFYRAVYRDSFDRLKSAAFVLERGWVNGERSGGGTGENRLETRERQERLIGEKALAWIQSFSYERDLMGSDFVNLISAAREGRGDCDSRAMLWAVILEQADISAAIMVSREYGHAMGLALIEGAGARFPLMDADGKQRRWLVAETTAAVELGMIGEKVNETDKWLGILFE